MAFPMKKRLLICIYFVITTLGVITKFFGHFRKRFQLSKDDCASLVAPFGQNIIVDQNNEPIANYTDVDISFSYGNIQTSFDFATLDQITAYDWVNLIIPILAKMTDDQLSSPQVQEFMKSSINTTYDLVFLEAWVYQAYHGLIHQLGSPPVIGILSLGFVWRLEDSVAATSNPSYIPDGLLHYSSHMTFYERLQNTIYWIWIRYRVYGEQLSIQEEIMRKHFGAGPPSVYEADRNLDLFMVGSNWLFNYPVPVSPSVVDIHSLHVKKNPDHLPKNLQKILDEAENGVIYFSLGSNVQNDHLPEEKRKIFVEVFSELPQTVIWKWESDALPGEPENVIPMKWLPQQDLLAHPNVKLFITQCGLQSFQEAVFHAVPLLGIPFFADQKYNAKKIHDSGVGLSLSFQGVNKAILLNIINEILHNPVYKKNMEKMSALSKDEPQSSIERAVWWTEYILRHKTGKHLRSAALDLTWYQYLLLDVVAFLFLIILTIIFILYCFLRLLYKFIIKKAIMKLKYD